MPDVDMMDTGRPRTRSLDSTVYRPSGRPPAPMAPTRPLLTGSTTLSPDFERHINLPTTWHRQVTGEEIATLGAHVGRLQRIRNASTHEDDKWVRVTRRWMGVVKSVDEDGEFFDAQLTPLDASGLEVLATLALDAVTSDDVDLIAPGTSFYLHAGRTSIGPGRTVAFTSITVRRLGRWRGEEVEYLRERARKRQATIDFE